MKKTSHTLIAAVAAAGFFAFGANQADAVLINITMKDATTMVGDIGKNSFPTGSNSNSPANHLAWLDDYVVPWYNSANSASLPDPSGLTLVAFYPSLNGSSPTDFSLTGVTYITSHYGAGRGGAQGQGGGIVAYYNQGMTGNYVPPTSGLGPNGFGGISTLYAWGTKTNDVPDGGMTLMLLGMGMGSLFLAKKHFKRG